MLKILGRVTSINVRKARWAADLIGLDYQAEVWGMPDRDPKVPEFLALNPNGQVPVLVEDGFVLWESNAIMRYLAERHRSGLWPVDPHERAQVDQWLTWMVAELNATWMYAVYAILRKNPKFTDPARIAESIAKWTAAMRIIEGQLQKTGFVANGRLSLADIAIALASHRWFSTEFDRPNLPAVAEHYRRMEATPEGEKYLSALAP